MKVTLSAVALLGMAMMVATPATAAFNVPPTYPVDFCDALDGIGELLPAELLAIIPAEYLPLLDLLPCAVADINGGLGCLDPEGECIEAPLGNGMLDGEYELGLVAEVINGSYSLSSGLTTAATKACYETNYALLGQALDDSDYATFLPILAPGLGEVLIQVIAGYVIVGDDDTFESIQLLVGLLESIGAPAIPPESFCRMADYFAHNGDADADGYTNRDEYDIYQPVKGAAEYVAAALDNTVPGGDPPEGEGTVDGEGAVTEPAVSIAGTSIVGVGKPLTLTAVATDITPVSWEWKKDDVVLPTQIQASLYIAEVALTDAGAYTVTVDDGVTKATATSAPFTVMVSEVVPLAGGIGLGLLAGVCALGGALVIRRKK